MDYYYVLGILPTATPEEVKAAYRKMATKHHPDKNVGKSNADHKFKEAKEAYETLSDPELRQSYDGARNSQILSDPVATAAEIWANFLNPCVSF
jgi:DnaJ-class molecular chaperone